MFALKFKALLFPWFGSRHGVLSVSSLRICGAGATQLEGNPSSCWKIDAKISYDDFFNSLVT